MPLGADLHTFTHGDFSGYIQFLQAYSLSEDRTSLQVVDVTTVRQTRDADLAQFDRFATYMECIKKSLPEASSAEKDQLNLVAGIVGTARKHYRTLHDDQVTGIYHRVPELYARLWHVDTSTDTLQLCSDPDADVFAVLKQTVPFRYAVSWEQLVDNDESVAVLVPQVMEQFGGTLADTPLSRSAYTKLYLASRGEFNYGLDMLDLPEPRKVDGSGEDVTQYIYGLRATCFPGPDIPDGKLSLQHMLLRALPTVYPCPAFMLQEYLAVANVSVQAFERHMISLSNPHTQAAVKNKSPVHPWDLWEPVAKTSTLRADALPADLPAFGHIPVYAPGKDGAAWQLLQIGFWDALRYSSAHHNQAQQRSMDIPVSQSVATYTDTNIRFGNGIIFGGTPRHSTSGYLGNAFPVHMRPTSAALFMYPKMQPVVPYIKLMQELEVGVAFTMTVRTRHIVASLAVYKYAERFFRIPEELQIAADAYRLPDDYYEHTRYVGVHHTVAFRHTDKQSWAAPQYRRPPSQKCSTINNLTEEPFSGAPVRHYQHTAQDMDSIIQALLQNVNAEYKYEANQQVARSHTPPVQVIVPTTTLYRLVGEEPTISERNRLFSGAFHDTRREALGKKFRGEVWALQQAKNPDAVPMEDKLARSGMYPTTPKKALPVLDRPQVLQELRLKTKVAIRSRAFAENQQRFNFSAHTEVPLKLNIPKPSNLHVFVSTPAQITKSTQERYGAFTGLIDL